MRNEREKAVGEIARDCSRQLAMCSYVKGGRCVQGHRGVAAVTAAAVRPQACSIPATRGCCTRSGGGGGREKPAPMYMSYVGSKVHRGRSISRFRKQALSCHEWDWGGIGEIPRRTLRSQSVCRPKQQPLTWVTIVWAQVRGFGSRSSHRLPEEDPFTCRMPRTRCMACTERRHTLHAVRINLLCAMAAPKAIPPRFLEPC